MAAAGVGRGGAASEEEGSRVRVAVSEEASRRREAGLARGEGRRNDEWFGDSKVYIQ